jgi:hypothetical protein
MNASAQQYPRFLRDYGALLSHFNSNFEGLSPHEKGERFVQFAKRAVPHSRVGEGFETPRLRQRTYDKGIDLTAVSRDGAELLCIQSKYTIRGVDDLDSIFSKFKDFQQLYFNEADREEGKQLGFTTNGFEPEESTSLIVLRLLIITSSDLATVLQRYKDSQRPSVEFYSRLQADKRIHIIDGPDLVPLLQKTYRKLHILPTDFTLRFAKDFIRMDDVYVGVVASAELKRLHDRFGDALFIENIREFLGSPSDQSTYTDVNKEILRTLEEQPEKFLAKNNGIAFRANRISAENSRALLLTEASIVNGFQTTQVVVENPDERCHVLAKVVRTEHSWEIAKAANFQNRINRIDLDLAEYIRPRTVRTAATKAGVGFRYQQGEMDSIFAVLDTIYQDQITYREIRSLFIGLFSRNPNNAIDPDYGQLRTNIIDELYKTDVRREKMFTILFNIQKAIRKASVRTQEVFAGREYASLFRRFWEEAKPRYRAFLAILTMCGCVRSNIYDSPDALDFAQMEAFLKQVNGVLESEPEIFIRYFRHAFVTVADDILAQGKSRSSTLQVMTDQMHRAKFAPLYLRLCLNADNDDQLRAMLEAAQTDDVSPAHSTHRE